MSDFNPKPPQPRIVETPKALAPALEALHTLIKHEVDGETPGKYRRVQEIVQAASAVDRLYKLNVEDFVEDDPYGQQMMYGAQAGAIIGQNRRRGRLGHGAIMDLAMGGNPGNDDVRAILEPLMAFAKDMTDKTNKKTESSARRSRLDELREARDEAEARGNADLAKRMNDKIDALLTEIASADDNKNDHKENDDVQEPAAGYELVPAFLPR